MDIIANFIQWRGKPVQIPITPKYYICRFPRPKNSDNTGSSIDKSNAANYRNSLINTFGFIIHIKNITSKLARLYNF